MSKVINFIGGPGAGKSTMAALLFVALKQKQINCELVTEYPKDLIWEENMTGIRDQLYIFANQAYRQELLRGKVDIIITDSPIILSLIYNADKTSSLFKELVIERFKSFDNINYFINRNPDSFELNGRIHDPIQSRVLDNIIKETLNKYHISFKDINHSDSGILLADILRLDIIRNNYSIE